MKAVERRESGDGWMRLDADEPHAHAVDQTLQEAAPRGRRPRPTRPRAGRRRGPGRGRRPDPRRRAVASVRTRGGRCRPAWRGPAGWRTRAGNGRLAGTPCRRRRARAGRQRSPRGRPGIDSRLRRPAEGRCPRGLEARPPRPEPRPPGRHRAEPVGPRRGPGRQRRGRRSTPRPRVATSCSASSRSWPTGEADPGRRRCPAQTPRETFHSRRDVVPPAHRELLDLAPVVRRQGGAVSGGRLGTGAPGRCRALPHSPTSAERTSPA